MSENMSQANSKKSLQDHSDQNEKLWFLFRPSHRLNELRAFYEAGAIAALYDALVIIRDSWLEAPEWVISGATRIVAERLEDGRSTAKAGASANEKKQYSDKMKRYRRWQVVRYLREEEKMSGESVFSTAQELLSGHFAGNVEIDAIKKGYYRVRKDLTDPIAVFDYYRSLSESRELTDTPLLKIKHTKSGKK